jgi:hypothetical protein
MFSSPSATANPRPVQVYSQASRCARCGFGSHTHMRRSGARASSLGAAKRGQRSSDEQETFPITPKQPSLVITFSNAVIS